MSTAPELKPCPFCQKSLTVRAGVNAYGRCDTPSCWMEARKIALPLDDPEQVRAWNRRAALREAPVAVKPPEAWELEAAAIFMDHVDDDETGSVHRVAAFLRAVAASPAGVTASPASHGVVTKEMVNAAWNKAKTLRMTGSPPDFRQVIEAALAPALAEGVDTVLVPRDVLEPFLSADGDDGYQCKDCGDSKHDAAGRCRYSGGHQFEPTGSKVYTFSDGEIEALRGAAAPEQEKSGP